MTEPTQTEAPSFESQLEGVLAQAGGSAERASTMEVKETAKAPVETTKPTEPNVQTEAKVEEKAPEKPEEKEDLLDLLSKGEDITEEKLGKPGDRPTDENSREFQTWKELRKAYDEEKKARQSWEKERAEIQAKVPADYEDLKRNYAEMQAHLAERDLTQTPQFQAEIVQPLQALYGDFERVADALKVNKDLLLGAIETTDELTRERKIHELFSALEEPPTPGTIAKLSLKADRIHELMNRQQELLKNAPDVTKALKEREEKVQAEKTQKERDAYEQAANVTLQVLAKTVPALMKDGKVDTAALEEAKLAAKTDWNALKPSQKALALIAPTLLQKQVRAAQAFDAERKALQEEIAGYKLKLSKMSGTQPGTTTVAPVQSNGNRTNGLAFDQLTSEQLRGMAV